MGFVFFFRNYKTFSMMLIDMDAQNTSKCCGGCNLEDYPKQTALIWLLQQICLWCNSNNNLQAKTNSTAFQVAIVTDDKLTGLGLLSLSEPVHGHTAGSSHVP